VRTKPKKTWSTKWTKTTCRAQITKLTLGTSSLNSELSTRLPRREIQHLRISLVRRNWIRLIWTQRWMKELMLFLNSSKSNKIDDMLRWEPESRRRKKKRLEQKKLPIIRKPRELQKRSKSKLRLRIWTRFQTKLKDLKENRSKKLIHNFRWALNRAEQFKNRFPRTRLGTQRAEEE
jgi:hypothetical protein